VAPLQRRAQWLADGAARACFALGDGEALGLRDARAGALLAAADHGVARVAFDDGDDDFLRVSSYSTPEAISIYSHGCLDPTWRELRQA
jgi:hypothetical protein